MMMSLHWPRSSGLLLHPSSLPGPYGIGDFGPEAFRWIETLASAGQHWWQVLPLGPTGFGDSPYQSFSAFAGNINLLSPDWLKRDGLLPHNFFDGEQYHAERVESGRVKAAKTAMVRAAWDRLPSQPQQVRDGFEHFQECEQHWLEDYALFMATRAALGEVPLSDWPQDVRMRHPVALAELEKPLRTEILILKFGQFLFDRQWAALRAFARTHHVKLIGDAPIFVSGDSADVWAQREYFLLDADGQPTAVAGVPPDYFSEDGQLWGNPLYDWAAMERTGYSWWKARLRRQLDQVDVIRLDHFRGFAAAWHVPLHETTAKNGTWVDGPRAGFLTALQRELNPLPMIAEDLGLITPDVHTLRIQFGLPGMRVLQFALGLPDNPYWPHNYDANTVAYTGTHDNDTTVGWFGTLNEKERTQLQQYVGHEIHEPQWDVLRLAWSSVANLAVAPLQDVLGLGQWARMNVPGQASGNWGWRFRPEDFQAGVLERLAELTERTNRLVPQTAGQ